MSADEQPGDIDGRKDTTAIPQVGPARAETLENNGYETVRGVREADVGELEELFPVAIAREISANAGDAPGNPPNAAAAKQRAQDVPGAKAKTVKQNGSQVSKVLRKVQERDVGGANLQIHRG